MLGREVAVLVSNELLSAGTFTADFNASNLSSGTYVYTLKTNNQVISKKMLLLKINYLKYKIKLKGILMGCLFLFD